MAVGDDIVVTAQEEQLVALGLAGGKKQWEAAGPNSVLRLAVGDGTVVAWGVRVFLVDAASGETIDEISTGLGPTLGGPLISDGLVVIQSRDERTLIAYGY